MPKLIDILRNTAPYIAGALSLGGPAGLAAGAVLTSVIGTKKEANEQEITKALATASPDTLLALRKADNDFQISMRAADLQERQAGIQETQVYLGDVANARQRQVDLKDAQPMYMAWLILGGFYVLVAGLLVTLGTGGLSKVDGGLLALMGTLLGYASAKAEQVVSFYFGSSASSEKKTNIIKQMWDETPSAADAVKKPLEPVSK